VRECNVSASPWICTAAIVLTVAWRLRTALSSWYRVWTLALDALLSSSLPSAATGSVKPLANKDLTPRNHAPSMSSLELYMHRSTYEMLFQKRLKAVPRTIARFRKSSRVRLPLMTQPLAFPHIICHYNRVQAFDNHYTCCTLPQDRPFDTLTLRTRIYPFVSYTRAKRSFGPLLPTLGGRPVNTLLVLSLYEYQVSRSCGAFTNHTRTTVKAR